MRFDVPRPAGEGAEGLTKHRGVEQGALHLTAAVDPEDDLGVAEADNMSFDVLKRRVCKIPSSHADPMSRSRAAT